MDVFYHHLSAHDNNQFHLRLSSLPKIPGRTRIQVEITDRDGSIFSIKHR